MATILGVISIVSMVIVIFLTYRTNGDAPLGYGFTGLLATLFSLTGLCLGLVTIRNRNYFRLFPVLGIILNIISLGIISLVLYF